ncbi:MAG: S-layer homology domain-containing protein [Brachybacterium tyrofermentans]|uniref:S-layer homology domain-containing protein n=1 Tax=Brachybacterium tyrofermentans TaxID=47848 RepID=UPI003FB654E1
MSTHHLDPTPDAAVWPTTAEEPSSEERTPRRGPSRRAVLVASAAAAVVPATGAVLVAAPALADPSVAGGETRIVDVPLADVALIDVEGGVARDLAEQPATMIGVTWPADADVPEVLVQGLDLEGEWSGWIPLEAAEDPETGEGAPGTEVGWIGAVSALRIRAEVDGGDVTEALVAHVVTTSEAPGDQESTLLSGPDATVSQNSQLRTMSATATSAKNPATPTLGSGAPRFVSRATWGSNESSVRGTSSTDRLKAVVIHHTAGTNNYSKSQSAQIIRGIQSYHVGTLGWADIGYNMLVDKYGQIFEGRGGGLHRNIVGAHAYGFNTGSFGISVLGDYSSTTLASAGRRAIAQVAGWKLLSTFQSSVTAKVSWTPGTGTRFPPGEKVSLPRIMGHRDVNYTECPGLNLYRQFGTVRSEAQSYADSGWTKHLAAFEKAGGSAVLGTVVKSAHSTGKYNATVLTKGLVINESGISTAYYCPTATHWQASWGRPSGRPYEDGERVVQAFSFGMSAVNGRYNRFSATKFGDVAPGRDFYFDINDLVDLGVVHGYGGTMYHPDELTRRDHMVVFIYRAMGSPSFTPPKSSPFSDVSPQDTFYKEVCWAAAEKISVGYTDGTFRPADTIRRDAVASLLYYAAGSPPASPKDAAQFSDVSPTSGYATAIGWLAKTGISRGYSNGTFRPRNRVPRDEMAAFLWRWTREV